MNQEDFLEMLRAEASCPMCLGILTDPVSLECGHHCCASCLRACWQDVPDILPCPVCQHHCAHKTLQKNIQMSYLTDFLKQLTDMEGKEKQKKEQPLCEQHTEVLSLFCEKDLRLLCARCRGSCEQQGHPLTPIQEAAAECRKTLKSHLQSLKKQLEETKQRVEMLIKQRQEFRVKISRQRFLVPREFENYKTLSISHNNNCDSEQVREITHVIQEVTEFTDLLAAHDSSLRNLLSKFTLMLLQTDLSLIKQMPIIVQQLNKYNDLEPFLFRHEFPEKSIELAPSQYLGLHGISKFHVDLTLDPQTAHHCLLITEDMKTLMFGTEMTDFDIAPTPPALTSYLTVLTSEGFEAGRHFWTVEIRGSGVFSLGVCRQDGSPLTLDNDGWKIQQPITSDLSLYKDNLTIGIFLDYELGEICFYDVQKMIPISTITGNFTGKLMPFFAIESSSLSMYMTIT